MSTEDNVIIFDTTLRDGEQALPQSLSMRQKLQIALALEELGVDVIETGFPISSSGDFESVSTIAKSLKTATPCALARCVEKDIVAAGEAPEVSLAREISEEAGLACGQWRTAGSWSRFSVRRPVEEGWMHEDALIMPVTVTDPARVHNTDGEVMAIELKSPDEVLERIAADLVPSDTAIAFLYATAAMQE